jgi:hypothetical protein
MHSFQKPWQIPFTVFLRRYSLWILIALAVYLVGCDSSTAGLQTVDPPRLGPAPRLDAGTDTGDLLDTRPSPPDTWTAALDTQPAPDTAPACPTVTVQLDPASAAWTATVKATTTGEFCFRTCDTVSGIGWTDFLGRKVSVNEQATSIPFIDPQASDGYQGLNNGGRANITFGSVERIGGAYNVRVSAGAYANATIIWHGTSAACP